MKYQLPVFRIERKTVEVFADNPAAAIQAARAANPGFTVEEATELLDEDEPGETYDVAESCETCGKPIMTGEMYYPWGGEDSMATCLKCGGADANHKPVLA